MKWLLILLLTGCGVYEVCDRSKEQCHGEKGEQGDPGTPGPSGPQGVPGKIGPSASPAPAGPMGPSGAPGQAGTNGSQGPQGTQGAPGTGCSIQQMIGGATISCTDGTSAVILNGVDGSNSPPTPYTVVGLVDPCGDQSGYDEVLLRLSNGTLLAHYSSGSLQFLTVVGPGNYQTTDNTRCAFTINNDLSISNEHNY